MNNAFVIDGQVYQYPAHLHESKRKIYQDYMRFKIDFANLDKTFHFPDGRTLNLPNVNYKKIAAAYDADVQERLFILAKDVYDRLGVLMSYSRQVGKKPSNYKTHKPEEFADSIIELYGRDYTTQEIHRIFQKKNRKMDFQTLVKFSQDNKEKIRVIRDKWRQEYTDVPITAKRTRLEKLDYLLGDLLVLYEETTASNKTTFSKEIRGVLEQARKEVEGDEIKLTISGRIDVDATINQYMTDTRFLQDLTIHQIVISRVAARLGISSRYLIDKLANSFYSQYNGFRKNDDLSTKILYPSATNYDILDLETKNKAMKEKQELMAEEVKYVEVTNKPTINKELLKSRINEMLKNKVKDSKKFVSSGGEDGLDD